MIVLTIRIILIINLIYLFKLGLTITYQRTLIVPTSEMTCEQVGVVDLKKYV